MKSFNEWLEARKLNESPGTITKPQPGTETEPKTAPKAPTRPNTPAHPWHQPKRTPDPDIIEEDPQAGYKKGKVRK